MPDIVVLVAHPQQEHSRVNQRLMHAAALAAPGHIEVRDLYALYPDYLIDVAAEQALLAGARLVVWQHPVHWYGMPPLMKLWLDEVFAFGWAYGPGGDRLRGKDLWLVASTGGPEDSYGPRLQPLLLRRLPAALRADRGAGRHALPAAAAAARRAPRRRGRTRRARADLCATAGQPSRLAGDRRTRAGPGLQGGGRRPPDARSENAAMEHGTPWLQISLVYLGAAVLAVPLARLLGLGSIIGYLAAGIAIGPWGLKLVTDAATILHFAEFGVVLMLFLVGLELEPKRLWALRRPIFGWGSVQLLGSAALIMGVAMLAGAEWRLALVAGLGLALSSTAIGLGVLNERNLMADQRRAPACSAWRCCRTSPPYRSWRCCRCWPWPALGLMVTAAGWLSAAKAVGVIAAIVLGGRLLLRPALRWIARSDTPEIFTAASLLLVVATAALMESVGLSMALGAFLAGVLLAESEYRRELETDLEPFKGLLLGLFFIAVGMSIDFAVVHAAAAAGGRHRAGFPAAEGAGAVGDGAGDAAAAGRMAGVHGAAGARRRVRLRRLPGGIVGGGDRLPKRRRCWSPRWRCRCC